jgi:hypothetical protein
MPEGERMMTRLAARVVTTPRDDNLGPAASRPGPASRSDQALMLERLERPLPASWVEQRSATIG